MDAARALRTQGTAVVHVGTKVQHRGGLTAAAEAER